MSRSQANRRTNPGQSGATIQPTSNLRPKDVNINTGNWQVKAVKDFDGDGKADILWQDSVTGDVATWLMNGVGIAGGGHVAKGVSSDWQIKTAGDYNGDGKADIVWQNTASGDVYLYLMDGINIVGGGFTATGLSNDWQLK
ncbi:FG-GAP repeat domain-containing protein [Candidatus Magnetobacterium bavaricum]|uniref:FG-GAP repeat domain-containing protein n=1 Tax=Candidatus Magnetobacterium bavaricum TaxID=29290 RepID=A0A0F3GYN9_9BACT|nr:FG-GAP repeat domain-containing protein [Candidatus Magnetobacterium bavaricum]